MLKAKRSQRKLSELNPSKGIGLFTDGSAWTGDRSGGWAWIAIDCFGGESSRCGAVQDTTNNRMEMMAWIKGLEDLHQALGSCEVLVFSDSENVGKAVMLEGWGRKANRDLWKRLDRAIELHDYVEWVFVRGHSQHPYNDRVDKMASRARKNAVPPPRT